MQKYGYVQFTQNYLHTQNFEALRTDVLKKIGITPKHRAEP